jgi:negative regulator of sigma-B (phosphoserine phosphatase)
MGRSEPIEWAVASRPKPGEIKSGDRHVVVPFNGGVMIAAIDALGHGEEAAESAMIAETALRDSPEESVITQAKYCHEAIRKLRGLRGVVMSIAKVDFRTGVVSWLSIGNVEGVLLQPAGANGTVPSRMRLLTRGGVVGSNLPELRAELLDVSSGGLLIFATDGIDGAFADTMEFDHRSAQDIADHLLDKHAKPSDDALALVAHLHAAAAQ